MDIVRLGEADCRLLAARCDEHENSQCGMERALRDAGAEEAGTRLRALRRIERQHEVDLGSLCHKFLRRNLPDTHPLECKILEYVAQRRRRSDGTLELWVMIDRVRQVRKLMDGSPVGGRDV